jgi:hypothetical protein
MGERAATSVKRDKQRADEASLAVSMRTRGHSWASIAAAIELSRQRNPVVQRLRQCSEADAMVLYRTAMKARTVEAVDDARALEDERLDDQLRRLNKIWAVAEQRRDLRAQVRVIRESVNVGARRAKLHGLDAPIKTEISGPDGGPVSVTDARAELLAKLERIATRETPEGGSTRGPKEPER